MTKVKICGITNLEDAVSAAKSGADFLGFVFYKKSKRHILPLKAKKIIAQLPKGIYKVGIFVNERPSEVKKIADTCGLDYLQFHGEETPAYLKNFSDYKIIKAIRVKGRNSLVSLKKYPNTLFLFDTFKEDKFGGTGEAFDWDVLRSLNKKKIRFFISGGLTLENVGQALRVRPFAADVSSGVEKSPGKKDHRLVKKFIKEVKMKSTTKVVDCSLKKLF